MRRILFSFLMFAAAGAQAQGVLINEVDADQMGSDTLEFVELVGAPNTSLDGYILVLFNGGDANNASYRTVDLTGQVIPASGFFVIGSPYVANVNINFDVNNNAIQNGADAIALYQAAAVDFPNGTAPTLTGLVDALVYGTADAEDVELMALFGPGQVQVDEGAANNTESMSRVPDGGAANTFALFVAQAPTPGSTNGGTVGIAADEKLNWSCTSLLDGKFWISSSAGLGTIQVWSLSGSLIQQYANTIAQTMLIDLSDCAKGMYVVSSTAVKSTLKVVR
ncbi:MAG: hypothetical protein RL609_1960 [Bacteroidota bacterium]|jgi:hypothetical protein